MKPIIHFFNGNDVSIQEHYYQKEYRNDVIVEIESKFFEIYFFVESSLSYEMRKDGFFSLPGLIILDEITSNKIIVSVDYLIKIGFFNNFVGHDQIPYKSRFINKWYENDLGFSSNEPLYSHPLA